MYENKTFPFFEQVPGNGFFSEVGSSGNFSCYNYIHHNVVVDAGS